MYSFNNLNLNLLEFVQILKVRILPFFQLNFLISKSDCNQNSLKESLLNAEKEFLNMLFLYSNDKSKCSYRYIVEIIILKIFQSNAILNKKIANLTL